MRQLPSGRWQATFPHPETGERVKAPQTYDTKLDATTWLNAQARDVAAGRWDAPAAKEKAPTVGQYAERWLVERGLKPRTVYQYRKLLDDLILPCLASLPVDRLTPTTVRNWHADLKAQATARQATAQAREDAAARKAERPAKAIRSGDNWIAQGYSLLRAICTTAVADELLTTNPCKVRGAGRAKTIHSPRPASLAEIDLLVDALPPRYRVMVLLAAWCGFRFGELTELRRSDVNLESGKVTIARGVVLVDGKHIVGDPKSEAGKRAVSVPSHVLRQLEAHLAEHVHPSPEALLFPARHGYQQAPAAGQHMAASALYKPYYRARETAGRPDLRFHDLRHTGATLAAAAGATVGDLKLRIGHSTAAAALRYQHAVSEDRDAAIALALSGFAEKGEVTLKGK